MSLYHFSRIPIQKWLVYSSFHFRFIDTDLNTARHMDSACRLLNSTILGVSPVCPLEADHNIYMEEGVQARAAVSGAAFIAMLLSALLIPLIGRVRTTGNFFEPFKSSI